MPSLTINGESVETPATKVGSFLDLRGIDPRTVAIEYNGTILPRDRFSETPLADGDRLEIVRFVQGG